MKKLTIFLFIVIASIAKQSVAQNLDSLWAVWNNPSQPDTNRLESLQKRTWEGYLYSQPDSAFYFAELQYNFAKTKGLKKYMAIAINIQGVSSYLKGEYAKAINYYTQSLKIWNEIKDKRGIANTFNNTGVIYKDQGDYAKAIDCFTQSMKIREEIEDKKGIANSLGNIGRIYKEQDEYSKAIDYYIQSMKIFEEIGDRHGIASSFSSIGIIYHEQGDYAKSIDYHIQSLKIGEEIGDKYGIASSLGNIGGVYHKQGKYPQAMNYYSQSLKIFEEIGHKQSIARSLNDIGLIYHRQGNYPKALEYSSHSLSVAQEIGAALQTMDAAQSLWETNKALGRYKEALTMYELFITTRDTIENEENQKEVIRQEYKYAYEKQAAADSVANTKANEVKNAQIAQQKAEIKAKRNQQYALYGGVIVLVVFLGFIYNRLQITNKQKSIIEEQKQVVEQQKDIVEQQKHIVEEKNHEITQSIQYAQKIQAALLPSEEIFNTILPDSFVLFKPKDIVSGDFYWISEKHDKYIFYVTADSTGHGVPGGFMSMLGTALLNEIVDERKMDNCGEVLTLMREKIMQALKQAGDSESKDGMDMVLIRINKQTLEMQYAAANNSFYIVSNKQSAIGNEYCLLQTADCQFFELPCDKMPVGVYHSEVKPFSTLTYQLQKGDTIYTYTDGYADQFGGEKGKKYTYKRLREKLLAISREPLEKQKDILENEFENWKNGQEQIDDVCLIGVRI